MTNHIQYIGVNDHTTDLFEGQYKIPNGMSYNSYVILDESIAVMDTVDGDFIAQWLENLRHALNGRTPDYLIVQHMEPDHSAGIAAFMDQFPEAKIAASAQAFKMMAGFFGTDFPERRIVLAEGSTLSLGVHELLFVTAPMVHWPEVIVTYEKTEKILFSADAFGKFGALDTEQDWTDEARRYYIGIVGKFGAQVQKLLQKASALEIACICPLHGPVLTESIDRYLSLYDTWSSYKPEVSGVLIAYTSVYGNTEKAVRQIAEKLSAKGEEVTVLDLCRCDMAEAAAQAFRYDRILLASTTYNGGVFPAMEHFLHELRERNFRNRKIAIAENGSWAPMAAKAMKGLLADLPGIEFIEPVLTIRSVLRDEATVNAFVDAI